ATALLGLARGDAVILPHGQDHAIDQVARALMIDNGARAELGDRQETGPREVFIALLGASPWNIGRERQAREVVAGQKALAGEVAVAVEIRLLETFDFG